MGLGSWKQRANMKGGFSLVELLTVLAIVAVTLSIGVPGFSAFLRNQQITSATNDFLAAIRLARSEAIQRGARVDLVPRDPDGSWAGGWVVFVDNNNNQRPDAGERVVLAHDAAPKGLRIEARLTDSTVQYLAYNGTGRSRTNASSQRTQFGTFTFRLNEQVRKIKLNFLGSPRACNPAREGSSC
ncbi:MAG TPA: GspH/FimT family pseudopilin [Noviherbaspirillum sp.]|uniref:GspH/FimT family pseudopilin n=1 Tax=Noviherbaspirillum sp. TaxID=1926288 RepID=UPI002B476A81|nr:GspH/FimT family pseudopilin [Noviherbaspirillum sp.]HJV85875.1 GspH/FimT family pseudopilin [Noviherbaspirillum sp.]